MHDFSHKIHFYCWKKLKKMHFHSNWLDHLLLMMSYLLTIATDHKLVPKTARGMNEQLLWKRQVLMFYTLGKNRRNLMKGGGGWHLPPPPSPLHPARPRINSDIVVRQFWIPNRKKYGGGQMKAKSHCACDSRAVHGSRTAISDMKCKLGITFVDESRDFCTTAESFKWLFRLIRSSRAALMGPSWMF